MTRPRLRVDTVGARNAALPLGPRRAERPAIENYPIDSGRPDSGRDFGRQRRRYLLSDAV
ncbi:MAG: hypothetical protein DWQ34_28285 [Planctomycetota bacterium]|nr:MAG: hypothetical protein DWQ34_28285 [Planctomycetota bacterium]REJ90135.1 MAG: hypothetical protein DWQ29_06950 [Planctomycetota bacterium]REK30719.1 MAG: hypothetical protein DWQ41_01865 [Planctomycetota bacterium]REK33094.1 MAG: hypothetical protein DWQ45_15970 [Planctomycetota bacterium]